MIRVPRELWLRCDARTHSFGDRREWRLATLIDDVRVESTGTLYAPMGRRVYEHLHSTTVRAVELRGHWPSCRVCDVVEGNVAICDHVADSREEAAADHELLCEVVASPTGRVLLDGWSGDLDDLVATIDALEG